MYTPEKNITIYIYRNKENRTWQKREPSFNESLMLADVMLDVVSRRAWFAGLTAGPGPILGAKRSLNVFVAQTRTFECDSMTSCSAVLRFMQNSAQHHKKITDIPFNFLIGGDGRVYEGRGFGVEPTLPTQYEIHKANSMYIAYMQRHTFSPLPENMVETLKQFIALGVKLNRIDRKYKLIELYK